MSDRYTKKEIGQWLAVAEPSPETANAVMQLRPRCHLDGDRVSAHWWNINEGWVERGTPLVRFYGTVTLALDRHFKQHGIAEWLHENDIDFHFTPTGALAFANDDERDLFILRWAQ